MKLVVVRIISMAKRETFTPAVAEATNPPTIIHNSTYNSRIVRGGFVM